MQRFARGIIPRFHRELNLRSESLILWRNDPPSVLTGFKFQSIKDYESAPQEAIIRCQPEAIQQLFDDLWTHGYRPTEDKFGASKFEAATAGHIADLRSVNEKLFSLVQKKGVL